MSFNLLGGMQALANFGTGYRQGQEQNTSDAYNKTVLQESQLRLAQEQQQAQLNQAESDHMMRLSMQAGQPPAGSPSGPPGLPGQPGRPPQSGQSPQVGPPGQPSMDPIGQMHKMYQYALSKGDSVNAGKYLTMETNLQNAKTAQEQKQALIQKTNLASDMQSLQYVTQTLTGVHDQQSYTQAVGELISNPNLSKEERQNLSQMPSQYNPTLVDHMINTGTNVYQQKSLQQKNQTARVAQQQRQQEINLQAQRLAYEKARTDAYVAHEKTMGKTGAVGNAPTLNELKDAAPLVQKALNLNSADPNLMGANTFVPLKGSMAAPRIDYNTPALIGIVSQAKEFAREGMSFPQAIDKATKLAVQNGQLQPTDVKGKKSYTYHNAAKGESENNPIPLSGLQLHQLVEGKWYSRDGQVEQYHKPQ